MATRAKAKPTEDLLVCWMSFSCALPDGTSPVIPKGTRLRADEPPVLSQPQYFVRDGASHAEIAAAATAAAQASGSPAPVPDFPRIGTEPELRDEDALVCITPTAFKSGLTLRPGTIQPGQRVHRDSEAVTANPYAFRTVVPKGLDRRDALVAKATMSIGEGDNMEAMTVYEGQWVAHDHPLVKLHPTLFELPRHEAA